ncbi:hypothetical protein M758_1G209800 [Ceratodon purpureus]|nr:hypothetical protein M758_1G209800 [Ceratodon purpureus]
MFLKNVTSGKHVVRSFQLHCFAIIRTNTSVMSLKLVDPGPSARTQVEKTSGEAVSNKSNQLHHQIDNEMANVVSKSR